MFIHCTRIMRRFMRDTDGGVAIEFGAVMMPFTIVVIGTIEVMLAFFSATMVENAIAEASRVIRTGQIQDESDQQAAFRKIVCEKAIVINCEKLIMNVKSFGGYEDASLIDPASKLSSDDQDFDAGDASDIVVAQLAYDYHFVTPMLGRLLPGAFGDDMRISAATVIKNEPYQNR